MSRLIDHRIIGERQKLFFFDSISQGSCFFLPRGAAIYNKLIDYVRRETKKRGYLEVITPNVFDSRLWVKSGHWDHYSENIIKLDVQSKKYSLKPMNCPAHCLIYRKLQPMKQKDLPIKLSEYGVLHRNELSGSLTGLIRGRRFVQDDAHIFCTEEQIESEVSECLSMTASVYEEFNLDYKMELSLRPLKYLGDPSIWDHAEGSLRKALEATNKPWQERKFEGAFYGPKIDVIVKDSLERFHQCATIQLDFQLPSRFKLSYFDEQNLPKQPVIIHRAMLGSVERFFSMLTENYQGMWPFWLSPFHAKVIPIHSNFNSRASYVQNCLSQSGYYVDADLNPKLTLNKKVREAQILGYNFLIFIGQREEASDTVSLEMTRKDGEKFKKIQLKIKDVIDLFDHLDMNKSNNLKQSTEQFVENLK